MITARLLAGGSGSSIGPRSLPSSWGITREAANPIITTNPGNPAENLEQYNPGPIEIGGYRWVYVKGFNRIYAWRSGAAGALPYTLQNGGAGVILPGSGGQWDSLYVVEPTALYDAASGTIHVWYKGVDSADVDWSWGHATAPGSTPTVLTKDPANPILTGPDASADLGFTCTDLVISDVVVSGGVFHFFGNALNFGTSEYHLIHATGTTFNDPSGTTSLLAAQGPDTVVQTPSIVEIPGVGLPIYAMLYAHGTTLGAGRSFRVASSTDLTTWDFSDTTDVISPTSGWEANSAYAGHFLKETASPWLAPKLDASGRWLFYYSGYTSVTGDAQTGIIYMEPTY